tara:strand:+ start:33 stop:698 length:666 start_codon:yes stop_codon:yes gene_type:complete
MEVPDIDIQGVEIPYIRPTWVSSPFLAIPRVPSITETIFIGVPIINIPGCVEAHPDDDNAKNLPKDDPDGTKVYCDANTPSFDPIDYTPENLTIVKEAAPPPVANTEQPNLETPDIPEIPKIDTTKKDVNTEEPVTPWVEEYLPSPAEVSTTASIAVIATGAAAATPLLLKAVKPIVKQIIKKIQRAFGKEPPKLTLSQIQTNNYRKSRGLSPAKLTKKSR